MGADEFFKLCGEGTAEDIIAALERGTVPDARPESASVGRTSPLVAAVLNDLDINVGGMKNITTPLIAVILNGETDEPGVISAFARSGADMNARDGSSGFTALMYASEAGKREMMKELARSGADVNAADDAGRTALMYAITGNQPGLVSDLIRIGADVNARDNRGRSAFSLSINPNVDSAIAIELIKNGANVNEFISSRDEWRVNDVSILMLAIINKCRPEVISALLDGGADVNAGTTKYGDTALLYAISGKSDPAITISLIERGAELNKEYLVHHGAAFKYTALMWAIIYRSDIEVLRRMIRRGADVNARIGNGPSALDCAIDEQYAEAIALLKQHGAKK
jgi:ankyrin repeat protein